MSYISTSILKITKEPLLRNTKLFLTNNYSVINISPMNIYSTGLTQHFSKSARQATKKLNPQSNNSRKTNKSSRDTNSRDKSRWATSKPNNLRVISLRFLTSSSNLRGSKMKPLGRKGTRLWLGGVGQAKPCWPYWGCTRLSTWLKKQRSTNRFLSKNRK